MGSYGFYMVLIYLGLYSLCCAIIRMQDAYQPTSKMECNFVFMTE